MNRYINEERMNQSKEKSIDVVIEKIKQKPRTRFLSRTRSLVLTSLTLLIILVVMISTPTTPENPITISAYESNRIAEISYITSSLIGSNIALSNTDTVFLSTSQKTVDTDTEFENNDEAINVYFDMLRVFLEEDLLDESITYTVSEEDPNTQVITFSILEIAYQLIVTFDNNQFTGTLQVEDTIYQVSGTLESTDEEFKLVIKAVNGDDYVNITFKSETENEVEKKYEVKQRINSVETEQEIKISIEENEKSVDIKDGQNQYKLKKELEDGQLQYKLQYQINGVNGEAIITEAENSNGEIIYNYQIKEGNKEKEINHGKPDYTHDDDDNEGNGNPNNEGKNKNSSTSQYFEKSSTI